MMSIDGSNFYSFHGLGLSVASSHREALAAIHSRLRQFAVSESHSPALTFEVQTIPTGGDYPFGKPGGKVRPVYDPARGEVIYSDTEDVYYIDYDGIRVLCDPKSGHTRISVLESESAASPLWSVSHPMFTLPFIELLKRRGYYNIHAAGLCLEGRGILLPGNSGSGKSTLALALLRAGFGFLGDDTMFLTSGEDGLRILAFPDEVDVTDETASLFPELAPVLNQPRAEGWPKRQVLVEDVYGVEFVRECRPAILVFPTVADAKRSILKPMSRDEAVFELAPNILLTEALSSQAHLDALAELVAQSSCYRLKTGRDFDTLPQLLGELLT